jgi:DNA ligase-1
MQQIIKELESNNSRLFKEGIIKREAEKNNTRFFEGCEMALNKLRTFGIQKVPISKKDGIGVGWKQFCDIIKQLEERTLTGNEMRDTIQDLCDQSNTEEWNDWYRRILIKDLKCGVSEKTINSVVKKSNKEQYKIPVFECMLAHDSANHENKMKGKKFLDVKLDGVRVISIYNADNDTVTMYSRNGKILNNFQHIEEEILTTLASTFSESMVLDGEVVSDTFQDLMKQIHRKSMTTASDARLALFDILPLSEFLEGSSKLNCRERHNKLKEIEYNLKPDSNIFVLEKKEVDLDTDEGQKTYKDLNKKAVDQGYEGIMIKDIDAPYQCKRSYHMLKAKPFIEVSLTVKAVEEGTGRNVGKLGALIVEGQDDGKLIKTNVGSGLTDSNREEFWKDQSKLIGQVVEIRADAITQNQDSNDYSLRFPRFLRFRGFNPGEKL